MVGITLTDFTDSDSTDSIDFTLKESTDSDSTDCTDFTLKELIDSDSTDVIVKERYQNCICFQ